MRQVIDDPVEQQNILQQLHGHKRREGTYRRIANRYWWDNLHAESSLMYSHVRSISVVTLLDLKKHYIPPG